MIAAVLYGKWLELAGCRMSKVFTKVRRTDYGWYIKVFYRDPFDWKEIAGYHINCEEDGCWGARRYLVWKPDSCLYITAGTEQSILEASLGNICKMWGVDHG